MDFIEGPCAHAVCSYILDNHIDGIYKGPLVTGIFIEDEKFVAFDNTTNDCWVEEFKTREGAIRWVNGEEAEEIRKSEKPAPKKPVEDPNLFSEVIRTVEVD